jgi:hypothetical protein
VGTPIKDPTGLALLNAPPLLEKEGDILCYALIPNVAHPPWLHRPRTRTALAPDDHPVDPLQVKFAKIFQ